MPSIFHNQQYLIFILSVIYIYTLSDLLTIIDQGPSLNLVVKLTIPLWGKGIINVIDFCAETQYDIDFYEWWIQPMSTNIIISYIFQILQWIYDNGLHVCWDATMKHGLDAFFVFIAGKIIYKWIWIFNFSIIYLFFACLCTYSIYVKFSSSKTAFVTLIGKFVEMGSSMLLSDNLHRIEDYKDYCLKNKNSWMTYIIKLVIGYNNSTDTDGERMAKKSSDYLGLNTHECKKLYEGSLIRKVSSVVEVSKSVCAAIAYPFIRSSNNDISNMVNTDSTNTNINENKENKNNEKDMENDKEKDKENNNETKNDQHGDEVKEKEKDSETKNEELENKENEIKNEQQENKKNESKENESKENESKENESKENESKENESKENESNENESKENEIRNE
jgi:hypothetical protein